MEVASLACFCAIHNHGFDMLFSFSAIVQHTPCRPIGFSILKAGLNKSVLLSVYSSGATRESHANPSHGMNFWCYIWRYFCYFFCQQPKKGQLCGLQLHGFDKFQLKHLRLPVLCKCTSWLLLMFYCVHV